MGTSGKITISCSPTASASRSTTTTFTTASTSLCYNRRGSETRVFTFHSLRHTFATELFNQRKRPEIIQSLLGHSSITQTMDTYSHLFDDVDDSEIGGLDEAFG